MTQEQIAEALAQTDALGRDVAEKVVGGLSRVRKHLLPVEHIVDGCEGYPSEDYGTVVSDNLNPQRTSHTNIANALGVNPDTVLNRLHQLRDLGLVRSEGGTWVWDGGKISDFYAVREAVNYA